MSIWAAWSAKSKNNSKKKKISKRPETYIFRTSSPGPSFWQSLGKSVISILHDLSWSLQQTALKLSEGGNPRHNGKNTEILNLIQSRLSLTSFKLQVSF